MHSRRAAAAAFTLIELMTAVAIIGVLAAVAIPAFMKNARKAKSTEAAVHLNKIYTSSRSYVLEISASRTGAILPSQFPDSVPVTPPATCCGQPGDKCVGGSSEVPYWSAPTWNALHFSLDDPHYYQYEYESTGSSSAGPGSKFTARALGDLDCDTVQSTFEMYGEWAGSDHDVHGSAGMFQDKSIE